MQFKHAKIQNSAQKTPGNRLKIARKSRGNPRFLPLLTFSGLENSVTTEESVTTGSGDIYLYRGGY